MEVTNAFVVLMDNYYECNCGVGGGNCSVSPWTLRMQLWC